MDATNEETLIRQLADSTTRREAFRQVVSRYGERLYWRIRNIVVSHEDANDVLQNTFIKAWTGLDSFQGKSSLSTWLFRIAINESLDFLRRQRNNAQASSVEAECLSNILQDDPYFDGDKAQALLHEAISHLPDVQRTVFTLRYFDNLKYSEISQMLHTTEGALKASYHLAAKKVTDYVLSRL